MMSWFTSPPYTLLAIFLSTLGIYIVLIVLTRIFGKRSFSKVSSFDFAMTVAVGSVIATTILSKSTSLLQGVVGLASLYIIQMTVALLRRYKTVKNTVDNQPVLLMQGSEILWDNLRRSRVSEGDLRSKLREANVLSLNQVRAVVFETTGDISVLHTDKPDKKVEDYLLSDVKR